VIHDNLLALNSPPAPAPRLPVGPPSTTPAPAPPITTTTTPAQPPTTVPAPSPLKGPSPVTQAQAWSATAYYNVGNIVSYQGNLYQCTIAHQAQASWTPAVAPSLWREITQ